MATVTVNGKTTRLRKAVKKKHWTLDKGRAQKIGFNLRPKIKPLLNDFNDAVADFNKFHWSVTVLSFYV